MRHGVTFHRGACAFPNFEVSMPVLAPLLRILPLFFFLLFATSCGNSDVEAKRDPSVLHTAKAESEDGVEIAYQIKGDGYPVIVLVHGWSCDRTYWREQFDALTKHYTVVAIDLAGHGESGDEREHFTMQSFGSDIRSVIEKEGLRSLILAGHSMGGAAVLEAARQMRPRVLGLIGVDTYHDITASLRSAEADSFITAMRSDFAGTTKPWIRSMFSEKADSALIHRIVEDMSGADPKVAVNAFRQYSWYHHEAGFKEIGLPVYLLNSDHWPTNLAPLRRILPYAAMTTMPGLGHFVMLEDPDLFMANLTTAINYIRTHPAKK
jgi:pimeloyl-ACP methyl ester carboxylesterase